jgi:hypothetical protein
MTITEDKTDYSQPRTVWTPGSSPSGNDTISPWWGQIPKMIQESNDLTPLERNVYMILATRQAGEQGYAVHGKRFLANLIGMDPRPVHDAAEELKRRGIIDVRENPSRGRGHRAFEYEVLWAPQWRHEGDPEEMWNPPIILGPGKVTPGTGGYPERAENAPRPPDGLAENAQDPAENDPRSCTKASYEEEVLGSGWVEDLAESQSPDSKSVANHILDELTEEITDSTIRDIEDYLNIPRCQNCGKTFTGDYGECCDCPF